MTHHGNILSVQDNARGETTNYAYDDLSIYGSTPDALEKAMIDWGKFSK
jgi:hypothetical protein